LSQTEIEKDHLFVRNGLGQYSIWPADREPPRGWIVFHPMAAMEECIAYVRKHWVDIRWIFGRRSFRNPSRRSTTRQTNDLIRLTSTTKRTPFFGSQMNTSNIHRYLNQGIETLRSDDLLLFEILERKHQRQSESLSLVASSGGPDPSVPATVGASIVNMTAEVYIGKRYHSGCKYVEQADNLAIRRAKQVSNAQYANVQPHCASFAKHTILQPVLNPDNCILDMRLDQGGHLTRGASVNLSGRLFKTYGYGLESTRRGSVGSCRKRISRINAISVSVRFLGRLNR
jgi:uncharacterized protein YbdZ (MbtH family)